MVKWVSRSKLTYQLMINSKFIQNLFGFDITDMKPTVGQKLVANSNIRPIAYNPYYMVHII